MTVINFPSVPATPDFPKTVDSIQFPLSAMWGLPANVALKAGFVECSNRKERREFKKLHREMRKARYAELCKRLGAHKVIACDIGSNSVFIYNADGSTTEETSEISRTDFLNLAFAGAEPGVVLVIEEAHMRPRNLRSKAQSFSYDELAEFFMKALDKDIYVYMFPQMSTPKARGFLSGSGAKKSDFHDCQAICNMAINHQNLCSLRQFVPLSVQQFTLINKQRTADLDLLNDDVNKLRNNAYDVKDPDSIFHQRVQAVRQHLFKTLNPTQLEMMKLVPTKSGTLAAPKGPSYNKVAFLLITLIHPNGDLRRTSEQRKVPNWRYTKENLMGATCYHMSAGVTASNLKYHLHRHTSFRIQRTLVDVKGDSKAYKPLTTADQVQLSAVRAEFWRNVRDIWREMRQFVLEQHAASVVIQFPFRSNQDDLAA